MSEFTFRQRAGTLDWQMLSRIDMEEIMARLPNVDQLQRALDSITFSEFTSDDIRSHTVDNIVHLVRIMQMINKI